MSLIQKIENLQKKPESIRRRILFVSVVAIMFAVIVIWIFTLNLSSGPSEKSETTFTPFEVFKELAKDAYNVSFGSIKEAIDRFKK